MKNKYLSSVDTRQTTPFSSSEEAWFWFCLCENLKHEHSRGGESKIARPCESADIAIAVKRLIKNGTLKSEHLKVLAKYGYAQIPPHEHFGDTPKICRLWYEGLKFLGNLLKQKGIVYAT